MTSNQIAYWRAQEEARHNQASENINYMDAKTRSKSQIETKRSNLVSEQLKEAQIDAENRKTNASMINSALSVAGSLGGSLIGGGANIIGSGIKGAATVTAASQRNSSKGGR